MFDDARDAPAGIAHDAAIAAGIVQLDGQHRIALGLGADTGRGYQSLQCVGARQRHIAVQHQGGHIGIEMWHCLLDRMSGTQLLFLLGKNDVGRGDRRAHLIGTVPDHHHDARRRQTACGFNHMGQQGPAGQRMQDLG